MPDASDILWFKTQFEPQMQAAIAGTPLSVDFLTAIACQETGYIWAALRRTGMGADQVAALCVGDTLDADKGRSAFPRTRAELEAAPRGREMFAIAHQALVDMAQHIRSYAGAAQRASKFCHGFGVFQLDLQFFREQPDYFLNRDYEKFDASLQQGMRELLRAVRKLGLQDRTSLSDNELAVVGIVYNTGTYNPRKGLSQGYFDGTRYYGQAILDWLRMAHTVATPATPASLVPTPPGQALVAPPSPVTADGPVLRVDTLEGMLRLRREPRISTPPQANVVANLPDGHEVRAVTGAKVNGFIEVETTLSGALLRGFASAKYLQPVAAPAPAPAAPAPAPAPTAAPAAPAPAEAVGAAPAVTMPRRPGSVTRRRDPAGAHSLNETGQPGRVGTTPGELCTELAAIADWLDVDNPGHLRYQPHDGLTYCNIYAHDYCHLAGVYLPRVWWSEQALLRIADGETVAPLIGNTIFEVRANDLFRWLRGFGAAFGWRQTGTLTKLQLEVNQGAVGLVVARRKQDGRSGHIAIVVPETSEQQARRSALGEVLAPLQSQAGSTNFRYGTGTQNWWNGEQFAEGAFWLHA